MKASWKEESAGPSWLSLAAYKNESLKMGLVTGAPTTVLDRDLWSPFDIVEEI